MSEQNIYLELLDTQSLYLTRKYRQYAIETETDTKMLLPILFKRLDVSFINALRRIFTAEIPTLAFAPEQVKIKVNTTQYNDDVLTDRIGYITINMDFVEKSKFNPDKLQFAICDNDINKPLKNTDGKQSILKVTVHNHVKCWYDDAGTNKPVNITNICPYDSLLLTVNSQEEVLIRMTPSTGLGKDHSRWQSSIVMYKFVTELDLKPPQATNAIVEFETNTSQLQYKGAETKTPEAIILTIESIGKMDAPNIISRGFDVLNERLNHIEKGLYQDTDYLTIENSSDVHNLTIFKLKNEDHTMGHLLEFMCFVVLNQLIFEQYGKETNDLLLKTLSCYRKSHPMNDYIELFIKIPDPAKYPLLFDKKIIHEHVQTKVVLTAIENIKTLCETLQVESIRI
jgi:hypothetical protein